MSAHPLLKNCVMDWNSNIGQAVGSGLMAAGSGALNGFLGMAGARLQYKYNKKLMARQNQYEIDAFNRQLQAVRDMPSLQKEAMKAAGYSTADPNGTGFQQISPSHGDVGLPSSSVNLGQVDFAQAFNSIQNARLASSQEHLNEIEAKYRAKLLEGQIGKFNAEIKEITSTYPERIKEIQEHINLMRSEGKLNDEQVNKVIAETDNIKAALQGIKMDSKYSEERNRLSNRKLSIEIQNLLKDGRIKDAEAKLADMGIVCGSGLEMIVSALVNGRGADILDQLTDSFTKLLAGLPAAITELVGGSIEGFASWLKSNSVDKVKSWWNNLTN